MLLSSVPRGCGAGRYPGLAIAFRSPSRSCERRRWWNVHTVTPIFVTDAGRACRGEDSIKVRKRTLTSYMQQGFPPFPLSVEENVCVL